MPRLGSPGANGTNPDKPKAAGDSGGRRGKPRLRAGLGRNVFNHSSHLPSVTLRLRRDVAEGAGTAGRCWMLRLPRRLCGVRTCWRAAGLVQTRQQQHLPGVWPGSSRAESSRCPCSIPGAAPSSGDAPGAASAADAFPRLQHLKRRLPASSAFPDCCFQAVISGEMSSDAAGPSGHWQDHSRSLGQVLLRGQDLLGPPHAPGSCFQGWDALWGVCAGVQGCSSSFSLLLQSGSCSAAPSHGEMDPGALLRCSSLGCCCSELL